MGMIGEMVTWAGRLSRRMINRYNAEFRAHKFLDKGSMSVAPRHPTQDKLINEILDERPELKDELKQIHEKSEQLNEYLKKVYLTSTSEGTGTEPKKIPKLDKYLEPLNSMFYEPETPKEGCCTFTDILDILVKFQHDNKYWNASAIARHYKLDKETVVQVLMYYSLFTNEKFQFMNLEPKEEFSEDRKEVHEFQVLANPDQEPPKQIEQKKN